MEGSRSRKEITSARHAPCLALWLRRYESMGHLSCDHIFCDTTLSETHMWSRHRNDSTLLHWVFDDA
jgi:hypothetical protein